MTDFNYVEQSVERTLYERLRLYTVQAGFLPDVTQFPDTEAGYTSYLAALKIIVDTKKFSIEIFGASNLEHVAEKKLPRIVIEPEEISPGDYGLGFAPEVDWDPSDEKFKYTTVPPFTSSLLYNIRCVAETIEQYRLLNAIVAKALPRRGYIPILDKPTENYFIRHMGFVKLFSGIELFLESIHKYLIPDALEFPAEFDNSITFEKLKEVTVETKTTDAGDITSSLDTTIIP